MKRQEENLQQSLQDLYDFTGLIISLWEDGELDQKTVDALRRCRRDTKALLNATGTTEMEQLWTELQQAWEDEDGDSAIQYGIVIALRLIYTKHGYGEEW
jgi:hypothetical protein